MASYKIYFFALCLSEFSGMLISSSGVRISFESALLGRRFHMSVTRKVVYLSIYKVRFRKTFLTMAVLNFLLILRILVFNFFISQLQCNNKNIIYASVFCASFYLVENKFYSTFLDTFIYIM